MKLGWAWLALAVVLAAFAVSAFVSRSERCRTPVSSGGVFASISHEHDCSRRVTYWWG